MQLTDLYEECEAQMIEPIRSIPACCSQRIVKLNRILCTPLNKNEWLYVAQIRCLICVVFEARTDKRQSNGNWEPKLKCMCKAYGKQDPHSIILNCC